ncbi:glucan phosphoethanolaminetransferase (alkaline phosphatase superfamily) [Rhizobium aethiopicum]|uniref:Glucan phosphoethanolaminetransferase (Alkaline phosphatase superfamily) n=1 Tax=Rhizobium aethiopicum TaxID=1138170 RepID=A0A7W6MI02_9HYPH|nr:glucan phosphoethanolaminetransferase (alkaline phosphatase superfamily) [Rhizobium aethiopicum]MBB4579336.1 glucan phosphoethanolaminetransferase (alkaline phosphatase superfamily) [Rhizobium aethiopicum]
MDQKKMQSYNQRASKSFYFLVALFICVRFLVFVFDIKIQNTGYLVFGIFLAVIMFFYNFRPKADLLFLLEYNSDRTDDLFVWYFKITCGAVLFYTVMIFGTIFLNFASQTSPSANLVAVSKVTSFLVLPVLAITFPRVIASCKLLRAEYKKL